jgi:hypothetical protein
VLQYGLAAVCVTAVAIFDAARTRGDVTVAVGESAVGDLILITFLYGVWPSS